MGGGESKYVQRQEKFVKANVENLKKVLPERYYKQQIEGKLRQLYANSDSIKENRTAYINEYDWNKAKISAKLVYTD
jgi:hypothetical protein